jgi:hypothetical protein
MVGVSAYPAAATGPADAHPAPVGGAIDEVAALVAAPWRRRDRARHGGRCGHATLLHGQGQRSHVNSDRAGLRRGGRLPRSKDRRGHRRRRWGWNEEILPALRTENLLPRRGVRAERLAARAGKVDHGRASLRGATRPCATASEDAATRGQAEPVYDAGRPHPSHATGGPPGVPADSTPQPTYHPRHAGRYAAPAKGVPCLS